jgi:hypothetical protein
MKTDWALIRQMMSATIDICANREATTNTEGDRDATATFDGQPVRSTIWLLAPEPCPKS